MFVSPGLEKLIKWIEKTGSPVCWFFIILYSLAGAVLLTAFQEYGFDEMKRELFIYLIVVLLTYQPLNLFEKYWFKKHPEKKEE